VRRVAAITLALAAWLACSSVLFMLFVIAEGLLLEFVLKTETWGLWSLICDLALMLLAIATGFFVARATYRRIYQRSKSAAETAKNFS
jgi:hypothetical protein